MLYATGEIYLWLHSIHERGPMRYANPNKKYQQILPFLMPCYSLDAFAPTPFCTASQHLESLDVYIVLALYTMFNYNECSKIDVE